MTAHPPTLVSVSAHARRRPILLAGAALVMSWPVQFAGAQGVKDLMGKAQTQSDQRAVEELIRKLKGNPAAAPAPAAPAAKAPVEAQPKSPAVAPAANPQTAVRPVPPPAAPDPIAPDAGDPNMPGAAPAPPPPPAQPAPAVRPSQPATPAPAPVPAVAPAPQPAAPVPVAPAPTAPTPAVPARAVEAAMPSVDIEVYFDYGSDAVTPRAEATLMILGRALTDPRLAGARFLIAGHTDAQGTAAYNKDLSERRAASVRRFLIDRFGIADDRLVSRGFGFEQLKVPGRPRAVENRRVQVVNLSAPR